MEQPLLPIGIIKSCQLVKRYLRNLDLRLDVDKWIQSDFSGQHSRKVRVSDGKNIMFRLQTELDHLLHQNNCKDPGPPSCTTLGLIMAPGMAPGMAQGMAPGIAQGMAAGVAPGIAPGIAPGTSNVEFAWANPVNSGIPNQQNQHIPYIEPPEPSKLWNTTTMTSVVAPNLSNISNISNIPTPIAPVGPVAPLLELNPITPCSSTSSLTSSLNSSITPIATARTVTMPPPTLTVPQILNGMIPPPMSIVRDSSNPKKAQKSPKDQSVANVSKVVNLSNVPNVQNLQNVQNMAAIPANSVLNLQPVPDLSNLNVVHQNGINGANGQQPINLILLVCGPNQNQGTAGTPGTGTIATTANGPYHGQHSPPTQFLSSNQRFSPMHVNSFPFC